MRWIFAIMVAFTASLLSQILPDKNSCIYSLVKYEPIQQPPEKPETYALYQNYPDPFNSSTTIRYTVPVPCFVSLEIYNILGERVTTLVDEPQAPGVYQMSWQPDRLASGVYAYRLQAGEYVEVRRMVLLR